VTLYPQSRDLDLRREVARLEVPVFVVTGHYEARGRRRLAREWFDALEAPAKDWAVFPQSGHRPLLEEPDRFLNYLRRTVLPATYPGYRE
jgi:pimeloyl-ACP methyl ester carboxylesterase